MITIDIVKDFAKTPGWRTYEDGPKSGQEFFDKILKESFKKALDNSTKLKIILDGADGYTTSFLNEAFRLLSNEYGADRVWNNLLIVSNEVPKYILRIKNAIYEIEKG